MGRKNNKRGRVNNKRNNKRNNQRNNQKNNQKNNNNNGGIYKKRGGGKKYNIVGIRGLKNTGNTCFF